MKRKLVGIHRDLIRNGKFYVARNIYKLMVNGFIHLGLSDADWDTELILEDMGFDIRITHTGSLAKVQMK